MYRATSTSVYLVTLAIIFLTSSISMLLLFYYMDPESNIKVAITTIGIATFLTLSSFLTLIIYFFKKIYYRGEIFISHLNSSLRQGIFMTIFAIGICAFISIGVYNIKTAGLLFSTLFFMELIFQTMSD